MVGPRGGEGAATGLTDVPGRVSELATSPNRPRTFQISPSSGSYDDLAAAMRASASGGSALFIPPGTAMPSQLNQVLVPHDGTPSTAAALDAIEDLAAGTEAEVVVLHVLEASFPVEPGSFQGPRMVDHDGDHWGWWREEFGRRFRHRSVDLLLRLQLAVGARSEVILQIASTLRADMLLMAWGGAPGPERARTLRSVCGGATCPVLLTALRKPRTAPLPATAWLSGYRL
jgi:hypothetical protein